MKSLNETLLDKISSIAIKNKVTRERVSPEYNKVYNESIDKLTESLDVTKVPSIQYRSELKADTYRNNLENITTLISTIADDLAELEKAHADNVSKYTRSENKIRNAIGEFKRDIDFLSNFACYNISELTSKQTSTSQCGRIGKYVTLPFFIGNVSMYNGRCDIGVTTSGNLLFSNTSYISKLPSDRLPSLKISSNLNTVDVNLTVSITETTSNMMYVKFENDVVKADVSFSYKGQEVYSSTVTTNETLLNYMPVKVDTINMSIKFFNQNVDKPLPIKMSDFKIFSNIMFSRAGAFESYPERIKNQSSASSVLFNYNDSGDTQYTLSNPLISISADESEIKYNIIDLNEDIDISLSKFKYAKEFDYSSLEDVRILGVDYKYNTILPEDQEWNLEYKEAMILYGINDHLLDDKTSTKRFENWTLSDNYWKTSVLNYEDNVYVDIKEKTCLLNGRQVTGKIKIPVGITNIDVHVKDIDFSKVDFYDKATVSNPYNLAYAFTGLPEYPVQKKLKSFNIDGVTTITLNESFMPFTEEITDEFSKEYKVTLTRMPYLPGTYSIEPYSGIIRIYPHVGSRNIKVLYNKSGQGNRPCGILFNRLLTFASLPNVLANKTKDDSLFTFAGTDTERFLILPNIPNITNSQMIYNSINDGLYFSTQVQLQTTNNYLTPIIDTMTLSVK